MRVRCEAEVADMRMRHRSGVYKLMAAHHQVSYLLFLSLSLSFSNPHVLSVSRLSASRLHVLDLL